MENTTMANTTMANTTMEEESGMTGPSPARASGDSGAAEREVGPGPRSEEMTRIVLRPLASPLPLGFLGLFMATLLVSAQQLHWIPVTQTHDLAIGVLAFTVPLQLIACGFGFLCRDVVAGTGIGVLAGTWATVGVSLLTAAPGSTSPGLGMVLVVAAGALLVPGLAAASSKVVAALVLAMAALRFGITGGYELIDSPAWEFAAGVAGVVLAGLALYGALAAELDSALRRTVLPLGRPARARRAVSGRLDDAVRRIAREAGVREQL